MNLLKLLTVVLLTGCTNINFLKNEVKTYSSESVASNDNDTLGNLESNLILCEKEIIKARCMLGLRVYELENILDSNAEILKKRDDIGRTFLMRSVMQKNKDVFEVLIERDADINAVDNTGANAISMSLQSPKILKKLIKANADLSILNNLKYTPSKEINSDDMEIVRIISKEKSNTKIDENIDYRGPQGISILFKAIMARNSSLVKFLTKKGVDVNVVNTNDLTPIMVSIGAPKITKILIEAGADVNFINKSGFYALKKFELLKSYDAMKSLKALIRGKANLDLADRQGRTALMFVSASGNIEVIRKLLKAGADIEIKDILGRNALMYATFSRSLESVNILLSARACINTLNKRGESPLSMAVTMGDEEIVKMLLSENIVEMCTGRDDNFYRDTYIYRLLELGELQISEIRDGKCILSNKNRSANLNQDKNFYMQLYEYRLLELAGPYPRIKSILINAFYDNIF